MLFGGFLSRDINKKNKNKLSLGSRVKPSNGFEYVLKNFFKGSV